ncbi:glutamate receptor 2.6-like isoform X2 [Primulina tabacum]|uniref:glutamate receptor 2.6-like isoform X2 n=1 Tax=Primulina tabacum TaxID=48773 RepID=UPI003F59C9AA
MGSLLLPLMLVILVMLPLRAARSSSNSGAVDFQVGVILDSNSPVGRIGRSCLSMAFADFYSVHKDYKTRLVLHFRDSNESVVGAAAAALDLLQHVSVDAIIGPQKSAQVNFVMNLGERAHVPLISFSATSPSLVPRAPFLVQTSQSDAYQVQAIASIIEAFKWNQVVVINEDTDYGNDIVPHLSNALNDVNARILYRSVVPESASDDFISEELYKMMGMHTRVFVVHASQPLGIRLFLKLRELGMISPGYAWIITSGLTELFHMMDFEVVDSMQGFLGVKPLVPNSKELRSFSNRWIRTFRENSDLKVTETSIFGLWAYDTLWALATAAESVGSTKQNLVKNKKHENAANPFAFESSNTGPKLLEALLETRFTGLAGVFKLLQSQLEPTPYQIVNFDGNHGRRVATWRPYVGNHKKGNLNKTNSNFTSKVKFRNITWPGNLTVAPKGRQIPVSGKHLRVEVPQKPGFNEFLRVEIDPTTKAVQVSGYHKQVFESVIAAYAVIPRYVPYPFLNADNSTAGNYDDLVYQVYLQEKFDAALGDITITYNRSLYAAFTLPYAEGGVNCVVPIMYEDQNNEFTIFKLLSKQLWITAAVFYLSNALAIWILGSRIASYARESPGQGLDANLLCLILVAWSSVSSLLSSTFTARLSSTLVTQRLRPTVPDVNQLIAKGYPVGCQEGSFVFGLLKNLGFHESNIRNYSSIDDVNLSLGSKNRSMSAYCDVVPYIRFLLLKYCGRYMTIEPTYRTEGFGFAFPIGSPLVSDISRAIIQLTENGTIRDIEKNLTGNARCSDPDTSPGAPTAITARTFAVPFVFSGFVTLACLLVSELVELQHKKGVCFRRCRVLRLMSTQEFMHFAVHALKRSNSKLVPILQNQEVALQVVNEDGVCAIKSSAHP